MSSQDAYTHEGEELTNRIAALKKKVAEEERIKELLLSKLTEKRAEVDCYDRLRNLKDRHFESFEKMAMITLPLLMLDQDGTFEELSTSNLSSRSTKPIEKAIQENRRLKAEFQQNFKQLVKYQKCRRCEKDYMALTNASQSCKYHPGTKRYFSCKNCGKDPYFTCCNWCDECIEGCALTYHI